MNLEDYTFYPFYKKISGDQETPITIYEKYVGEEIGFLLESKEQPKGRYSIIGKNPYCNMKYTVGENNTEYDFFAKVRSELGKIKVTNDTDFPFVGGAVGTIGYDMVRIFEKIPQDNKDELRIPDAELMFFKEVLLYDHFHSQIIIIVLETKAEEKRARSRIDEILQELQKEIVRGKNIFQPKKIGTVKAHTAKEEFEDMVKKAISYIYDGDIFQVVLSQRWSVETEEDAFDIYRRLRQLNPSPYLFYFNFADYEILGSSPEMLTELRGEKVLTCPIAGTRKRGATEKEDMELEEELKNDPKELAEHFMLVDLGRNDMGKIAEIGSVNVTRLLEVHRYSHVMHLVSLIEGKKEEGEDMFSVLAAFLPAGTLSGAPKIRAMEIIDELENEKRGVYGGAIGYFGFDGNMDTCIAIRMMIKKENRIYLQAGAGIVADSDPEKEFEETENKIRGMIKAITEF